MRLQLALNVDDLDEAISFYEKMFGTAVNKVKPGYANFAIENPPLKLVLFEGGGEAGTVNHLGVEVEDVRDVHLAEARMSDSGLATTGIDETVCCYAEKTETWIESPDHRWEWYVKTGEAHELDNTVTAHIGTRTAAGGYGCCTPESGDAC